MKTENRGGWGSGRPTLQILSGFGKAIFFIPTGLHGGCERLMAITNSERVGKALELLKDGLRPYVERELKATYK
jgi:hypothetical protein